MIHWAGGQGPANWKDIPALVKDVKRVIRHAKPDLIQAGPIQTAAFLVALTGFHPLVSMSWGYDLLQDAQRNQLWRWTTRYTLKHSAVMVGDCNTIRQKAISYGMPNERIVTFPWGIDLRVFAPDSLQSKGGNVFSLLSTRGWEPIYGVDVIARAFVLTVRRLQGESPELRLTMLGNGSQAAELRRIFLQGGVLDQVYFPGQVSQVDLPRYYREADLYISASHSDGTSISLLEAIACGCPALVSDIPGNREWIVPGKQGWLFADGDDRALAEGILHVLQERQHLPEIGTEARSLAEQRADWQKNFQELLRAHELAGVQPV